MDEGLYTERVDKLPPPADGAAFALKIAVLGGKPERFAFDRPRLVVGRGRECDLRIEHRCIGRQQFTLERSFGIDGEVRFRIVPVEHATNPTFVNGHPAVEGALKPGDQVAVGEVRITLEKDVGKDTAARLLPETVRTSAEKNAAKKDSQLTPVRKLLLVLVVGMAAFVGYLFLFADEDGGGAEVAAAQIPLFGAFVEPQCGNPVECDARAHEAYNLARKLYAQRDVDPGNPYRAAIEYKKAASYREQSGRLLPDMSDVDQRIKNAEKDAEDRFGDARLALTQAVRSGDDAKASIAAAELARVVPDPNHPYRIKLDAYRATLPPPGVKPKKADPEGM